MRPGNSDIAQDPTKEAISERASQGQKGGNGVLTGEFVTEDAATVTSGWASELRRIATLLKTNKLRAALARTNTLVTEIEELSAAMKDDKPRRRRS